MSLSKKITLSINGYNIDLSDSIKLYQNDQLKLIFTINEFGIEVANGHQVRTSMSLTPLSAKLFFETPLGVDSVESADIEENTVTFYLNSTQTQHIGTSRMQIQLTDADGCQVTLPPFEFEIRKNIYDGEIVLNQVLLADEFSNLITDENGFSIATGTQVSSGGTYAIPLPSNATTRAAEVVGAAVVTKQIKDYNLKTNISGDEDILIQDMGITKRVKASSLRATVNLSNYYTKEEVNALLNEMDVVDIDLSDYYDKTTIDNMLNNKANANHNHDGVYSKTNHTHDGTYANVNHHHDALYADANHNHDATYARASHTHGEYLTSVPEEYVTDTKLASKGYATQAFVTNKIAEAQLSGGGDEGSIDLSGYATKDELDAKANVNHNHDTRYALKNHTHNEYLTEHQDVSHLQTKTDNRLYTTNKSVVGAINELFQSVSDGKRLLASALTDKGIPTLATESFEEMAQKILQITTSNPNPPTTSRDTITTKAGDTIITKSGDTLVTK